MNIGTTGSAGEEYAAEVLTRKGYEIITRNYRSRFGEIDIICKNDKFIAFVEVKTRSSEKYGEPKEAVNFHKQKKILSVAKYYLAKQKEDTLCRFDVIEVKYNKENNKMTEINHIEDAFWCN